MGLEIEYKYLVKNDAYRTLAFSSECIRQGYLNRDPLRTVRVRIKGDKGFLTVKGINSGAVREEFEYEIPVADARRLLCLCVPPGLEQVRYMVEYPGQIWEVDEVTGEREGLVTAVIELKSPDEKFEIPDFVGEDVTGNPAYYNSNLTSSLSGS